MTAYVVTGTLNPDAATENTGEPAGVSGGFPYWSWTNDAGTWYMYYSPDFFGWWIGPVLGVDYPPNAWSGSGPEGPSAPVGTYSPTGSYTGTCEVTEYVPPPEPAVEKILSLEILVGPNAGKYVLLKESV